MIPPKSGNFRIMKIETKTLYLKRCVLRKFTERDDVKYHKIISDAETMKFIDWGPAKNLEETQSIIKKTCESYRTGEHLEWVVELFETQEIIGSIIVYKVFDDLSCEIAYIIGKGYWNNGYATEIVAGLAKYLFSSGIKKILAKHALDNPASGKVLLKNDFCFVGIKEKSFKTREGRHLDCACYELTPDLVLKKFIRS